MTDPSFPFVLFFVVFSLSKMEQSRDWWLWQACTNGNLDIAKELVADLKVYVNWVGDDRGDTPLHRACRFGHLEIVKLLLTHPHLKPDKGNQAGGSPFFIACQQGHKEVVSVLLRDPRIDPSKEIPGGFTPFFYACRHGHTGVASLLLADPRIDPHKPASNGATPLVYACHNGHKEMVYLLLADPRIDPNKPTAGATTPLWMAAQNGHLEVVQHLLASGRKIDTKRKDLLNSSTAAQRARVTGARASKDADETEEVFQMKKTRGPLCADLIEEYERDPVAVRRRLQRQPGLREDFIGHLFALVVFHSDGYLKAKRGTGRGPQGARRFFEMCSKVPMEHQMMICNQAFASSREVVLSRYSEPSFQTLSRSTTWQ